MVKFRLHHLPILTAAWLCLTFTLSYAITVGRGDAYGFWPYISDTGTLPPESCIFGLFLNIGSFLMLITMYIRYRYVEMKQEECDMVLWKWNTISLYVGSIACFGMCMVANFQETSNIVGHLIGAQLAFFVGSGYFIIQAYITWHFTQETYIRWLRIVLSSVLLPFFIMTSVFSSSSMDKFKPESTVKILWWTHEHPGYAEHLVATFSEWMMAVSLILYILTYTTEFKEMEYGGIQINSRSFSPVMV